MKRVALVFGLMSAGLAACSSALPGTGGARDSGQSHLMDKTLAGAKCDPKSHDRPFVIEWDATDMSSYEAIASNDVVFVKYVGCDLKVVDSCKVDDQKGLYGAYKPVDWTAGTLEKLDIKEEGELYAKLPLGANTLSGRVAGGEQFHMEYFVSGTRTATRPAVYRKDIAKNAGCKGVTHFVYNYNLGAFALGSQRSIKGEVGATVWGIDAGASRSSLNNAEKKGGVLTACRADAAREVDTCKVPIRLTLREISEEDNPDAVAAQAPETPSAANLAGKVDVKIKMNEKAQAFFDTAKQALVARDGKACLAALDSRDKADTTAENLSTNPKSDIANIRAQCVMLNGQCDAGKDQMRKFWQAHFPDQGPERTDSVVMSLAGQYCQGGSMSPRDQLAAAARTLQDGAFLAKKDAATCLKAWDSVKKLSQTVKPKDEQDAIIVSATTPHVTGSYASTCLARAGDCANAYKIYEESQATLFKDNPAGLKAGVEGRRKVFENNNPTCKGK